MSNKLRARTPGGAFTVALIANGEGVLDFPPIAAGGTAELTVPVTGAAADEPCLATPGAALESGLGYYCRTTATDTVTIRLTNHTTSAINPVSNRWRVLVYKY